MDQATRRKHRKKYLEKGLSDSQESLLWELKSAKAKHIRSSTELLKEAIPIVLGERRDDPDWLKAHFSDVVANIERVVYGLYKEEELVGAGSAMVNTFSAAIPSKASQEIVLQTVCQDHYATLNEFFLSLAQSRKSRAGSTFENIVTYLFDLLQLPYTSQAVINGKPDFLMPNREHYVEHAMDCIIFTLKRTLRERWRQITTEGTKGSSFFLGTLDADKTESDIQEMLKNRIYLVVPSDIHNSIAHYENAVNVLTFEVFFRDHVDPAMRRWRQNGVI